MKGNKSIIFWGIVVSLIEISMIVLLLVANLPKKIEYANKEKENLSKIDSLNSEISQLQNENQKLENDISDFCKENKEIIEEYEKWEAKKNQLKN